jgi:hypothetical protein
MEAKGTKVGIMQPYFFPYIGYFQLIQAVDLFIIYDNIKYTKRGWINRNRILQNGSDALISLPIKRDSDFLDVRDRAVAESFNRDKFLNKIIGAYNRAPYFEETFFLIKQIIQYENTNLFCFLHNAVAKLCEHLSIMTEMRKSSDINIDHNLKSQDKVLSLCEAVEADVYINAIGGIELYSKEVFLEKNIDLKFIQSNLIEYRQFEHDFCPWLSIIDVMMFNSKENIDKYLNRIKLL